MYHDEIIFDFFGVWRLFTPNVLISILLANAFPLSLLVFRFKNVVHNNYLVLAWINLLIAIGQFGFFAEKRNYGAANFMWGYNIALHLLFVLSTVEFLRWLKDYNPAAAHDKYGISVASVLFSLHLCSGLFYFGKIFSGGNYF